MENIAILYICTGNYSIFFKDFYKSVETNFLPNYKKHYFVFTDKKFYFKKSNIEYIYQKKIGWPFDTLLRFHFFYKIIDKLQSFEYTFFFNANALCIKKISDIILPINNDFVVAIHPSFIDKSITELPYERNSVSTAFIDFHQGQHYFQACFFGGKSNKMKNLIIDVSSNIDIDLHNNYIAIWHDESHLNKYLLDKNMNILDCSYIYPEHFEKPYQNKIIMRDKNKLGGHQNFRNKNFINFYILYIISKFKNILKKII
jgi:hypothetical protein